jgi:hypothetical protein
VKSATHIFFRRPWKALIGQILRQHCAMARSFSYPFIKLPAVPLLAAVLALIRGTRAELFCGARSYASAVNAGCNACPAHAARLLQDAATAAGANSIAADCLCEEGFYDASISSGSNVALCVMCPPGAACDGRRAPPRALAGFWRLAGPNAAPQAGETFWPCSPWHACTNTAAAAFVAEEGAAVAGGGSDSVGGAGDGGHRNGTTVCAGHRTGARCDGVAPGFRLVGGGTYELACVPALGRSSVETVQFGACTRARALQTKRTHTHTLLFPEVISVPVPGCARARVWVTGMALAARLCRRARLRRRALDGGARGPRGALLGVGGPVAAEGPARPAAARKQQPPLR